MRPYDCAGPAANKSTAGAQHTLRLHCGFVYIRWLPQRVAQYCSSMRMSTVTTGHVHNRAAVFTVPSRPACRRAERELQEPVPEAAGRVRALRGGGGPRGWARPYGRGPALVKWRAEGRGHTFYELVITLENAN